MFKHCHVGKIITHSRARAHICAYINIYTHTHTHAIIKYNSEIDIKHGNYIYWHGRMARVNDGWAKISSANGLHKLIYGLCNMTYSKHRL